MPDVHYSGTEGVILYCFVQFLFRTRIFRDKTLRESFGTEQEFQLRETIYKIFCVWRKHEYTRISELVSSFKEVLVEACNDRATFPQVFLCVFTFNVMFSKELHVYVFLFLFFCVMWTNVHTLTLRVYWTFFCCSI